MPLHPSFFNRFLLAVGVIAILLIAYFTLQHSRRQHIAAINMVAADSLIAQRWLHLLSEADSLQLSQFKGRVIVLDFWATWSGKSLNTLASAAALEQAYRGEVVVVAAAVKDATEEARVWAAQSGYPFHFVDGTVHYQDLRIVGVPSRILFDRTGVPRYVLSGTEQMAHTDSLVSTLR